MRFQLTAARLALAALVAGALCAALAVVGVRGGLIAYAQGLAVMAAATGLGLVALAAALTWLVSALKHNRGEGKRIGLIALVGAGLLLWPPLSTLYHRLTSPAIHDVTTDTDDPPRFAALLRLRGPGANPALFDGTREIRFHGETDSIDYVLHDEYPQIMKPHSGFVVGSKNPAGTIFWRAFEATKRMGWTVVDYSEKDGRIEATDTSFWFGRIADIVIRVQPAGMGARTDVRSESRFDAIDDGVNAARIKRFFQKMRS